MQRRTRLTTPPGEEPATDEAEQAPRRSERYAPYLARPTEPRWPTRYRRLIVTLVSVLVLGLVGYIAYRTATSGQFEDPSLIENPEG